MHGDGDDYEELQLKDVRSAMHLILRVGWSITRHLRRGGFARSLNADIITRPKQRGQCSHGQLLAGTCVPWCSMGAQSIKCRFDVEDKEA